MCDITGIFNFSIQIILLTRDNIHVCKLIYSIVRILNIFLSSHDNEKLAPTGVYVLVNIIKIERKRG